MSEGGDGEADLEALRSARDEARTTLDKQLERLRRIDEKAMRTVRFNLLVFGGLATALTVLDTAPPLNWATAFGLSGLLLSTLLGIFTYTTSAPEVGAGPAYAMDARTQSYSEREWLLVLLEGYREWIRDAERQIEDDATLLEMTLGAMALALFLLARGVLGPILPGLSLPF